MADESKQKYVRKMQKRKEIQDGKIANSTQEKGIIIVNTGKGKGKSTAAFGMIVRALSHNQRVALVQFIKGPMHSGERVLFSKFPEQFSLVAEGQGFTWNTQDKGADIKNAKEIFEKAKAFLSDADYDMVVLDEINIVLRYDYLELSEVIAAIESRPEKQNVILTGRNAKQGLIDCADLVTEMNEVKHPFARGVKAQAGIEF